MSILCLLVALDGSALHSIRRCMYKTGWWFAIRKIRFFNLLSLHHYEWNVKGNAKQWILQTVFINIQLTADACFFHMGSYKRAYTSHMLTLTKCRIRNLYTICTLLVFQSDSSPLAFVFFIRFDSILVFAVMLFAHLNDCIRTYRYLLNKQI